MKIIEKLTEMIDEEIEGAEHYAKCAIEYKMDNPSLAQTFYSLSMEELKHMDLLHQHVSKIITEHRQKHGEPPAAMMAVYDYLHKKQIDRVAKVKAYQTQYNS